MLYTLSQKEKIGITETPLTMTVKGVAFYCEGANAESALDKAPSIHYHIDIRSCMPTKSKS